MNCFRVQSLLSAYIDQELNAEDRRQIRTHIFNCPECSRETESLQAVKNVMGRLSAPETPHNVLFLVRQEVNGVNVQWSASHSYFDGRHLMMTAACVSLFLVTSLLLFPNRSQDNSGMHAYARILNSPSSTPVDTTSTTRTNSRRDLLPETIRSMQSSPILNGIPVSR